MKKTALYLVFTGLFALGCSSVKIQSVTESDIQLTDSIKAAYSDISKTIEPYRTDLEKTMNEVLNTSQVEMVRPEKGVKQAEWLLGNFVADLSYKVTSEIYVPANDKPVDFCILNSGGLRSNLPKGEITRGKVFELMPFENELVVLTLSGSATQKLFDYIAKAGGIPCSNISMNIKGDKPIDITVNEQPFDTTRVYKVVTSDYLARGGDKMDFFAENLMTESVGIKLRDAIIKYIVDEKKTGRTLTAELDKRISFVE